jgi:hypothetical protein
MLPSIDLRIQNLIKALSQVVIPAIDPENALAREQAQLTIAHLHLIAAQWQKAPVFEAQSLSALRALAERLVAVSAGGAETLRAAAGLRAQLDRPYDELGRAVDRLIVAAAADGDAGFRAALDEAVLDYGAKQAFRERVWFAGSALDPDVAELPSIDAMLRGESPA